jgi:hypothetical protein
MINIFAIKKVERDNGFWVAQTKTGETLKINYFTPQELLKLVEIGALDPNILNEYEKEDIKKFIINGKDLWGKVKGIRKIFKPEELKDLHLLWFLEFSGYYDQLEPSYKRELLELADYLNKKGEIEEVVLNDLKNEVGVRFRGEIKFLLKFPNIELTFLKGYLDYLLKVLEYYPEAKDRIKYDKEFKKKLDAAIGILAARKEINLIIKISKIFNLREYLIKVL